MSRASSKSVKANPTSERFRKYRSKKSQKIVDRTTPTTKGDNEKRKEGGAGDALSRMKSALGCPYHLLQVLLRQTDLDEASIHTRYMKFRMMYPTGYVGPHVLRELCLDVLSEEECEAHVDMVFKLFGQQRRGWGAKLIGFREVILATENIQSLREPSDILQWIFRVYDSEAVGELPVKKLKDMVEQIISLCSKVPDDETVEKMAREILTDFEMKPYDTNTITEEEFVYDCLNNDRIYRILRASAKKTFDSSSSSENEDEENNLDDQQEIE